MDRSFRRQHLLAQLSEGVTALATSSSWERYLACQARFHRYSPGNTVLILTQCPEATRVASFRTWQQLHRSVRRGEKAIWILAPVLERRSTADGGTETERVRGFRPVPVFDLSQTDGEPLPEICTRLHDDDPVGHYDRLVAVADAVGFSVVDHSFRTGVNGDCAHDRRRLRVERDLAGAQRVKTLAHELAHALLHEEFESRPVAELEAESVAFCVCATLGIDASAYSFGYLAAWAGGGEEATRAIQASCGRIQRAVDVICSCLEREQAAAGELVGVGAGRQH